MRLPGCVACFTLNARTERLTRAMKDLRRCIELADEQHGLATREQIRNLGLSNYTIRSRIGRGEWEPFGKRVLRIGAAPDSWRQQVLALCLSIPGTVASHRSAGALYGLDGIRPREIELLTTSATTPKTGLAGKIRRTNYLPDGDVVPMHGIPSTVPARTLLDLGGVVSPPTHLRAVEDALVRKLVTPAQLWEMLDRTGACGRPGTAALRSALTSLDMTRPPPESVLEKRCLSAIESAGLLRPRRQWWVTLTADWSVRIDLAYPGQLIGIEADGFQFHSARPDFERDRLRQNALVARGWRILRFTSADAERPSRFLKDLSLLLSHPTHL